MGLRASPLGLLLAVAIVAKAAFAEAFTIGVPELNATSNWLQSTDPGSMIVGAAVNGTLLRHGDKNGISFGIADSVQSTAGGLEWLLRIRSTARFHNSREITADDVVFSLERCKEEGMFQEMEAISRATLSGSWVSLKSAVPLNAAPAGLARCPIVERASSRIFGRDLGFGANLVSSGSFQIVDFIWGREMSLRRVREGRADPGMSLNIRVMKDAGHALTALRTGTLDLMFTEDAEAIEKAKKDETLGVGKCSMYMVIYRRSFALRCEPNIDMAGLSYRG